MKLEQLQVGTKLNYYHDNGTPSPSLCLAEVIQISNVQVKVRDEFGNEAWKHPSFFNAIVSEATYQEIMAESKPCGTALTHFDADGTMQNDSAGIIAAGFHAAGYHAGTHCKACGEFLDDLEIMQ